MRRPRKTLIPSTWGGSEVGKGAFCASERVAYWASHIIVKRYGDGPSIATKHQSVLYLVPPPNAVRVPPLSYCVLFSVFWASWRVQVPTRL